MQATFVDESEKAPMEALMIDRTADDRALVAAAKQGDKEAFEILVERHAHRVFATALRITGNHQDAEDAAQQTLQKAFTYLGRFEGKSAFSTWLTRIAINEALMLRRKGRSLREISIDEPEGGEEAAFTLEIPDSDPSPEVSYSQREQQELLSAAMEQLRPNMRRAIELRDLRELSVSETARVTGLSISAVKAQLFHARRKLREALRRNMRAAKWSAKRLSWASSGPRDVPRARLAYDPAGD